jgi:hypothetical protein
MLAGVLVTLGDLELTTQRPSAAPHMGLCASAVFRNLL